MFAVIILQSGFDAGDAVRYFALPGSRSLASLNLSATSNVGLNGRWIFRVDGMNILQPNNAILPGKQKFKVYAYAD